jgi:hypothetical protein
VWLPNCPAYFGQPKNGDRYVLSGVWLLCGFHSSFQQRNPVVLRHSDIGRVIEKQRGYAGEISNGRYTSYKPDKTRRLLFLGGFRT